MTFQKGDVVYIDGASAILGDVTRVEDNGDGEQLVYVTWRETSTCEAAEDLIPAHRQTPC